MRSASPSRPNSAITSSGSRHPIPDYKDVAERVPRRRLELLLEQMKHTVKPQMDEAFFGPAEADAKPANAPNQLSQSETSLIVHQRMYLVRHAACS